MTKRISRRTFFEDAAGGAGGLAMAQSQAQVPKRPMGRTGLEVSCMGLGGYHLGAIPEQSTIDGIVGSAIDAGVNFFDNAWEYHDGRSEEVAGRALKGKRDQVIVMTKSARMAAIKGSQCASWKNLCAVSKPIISMSDRSTKSSTGTIPT